MDDYWKNLVSTVLRALQEKQDKESVYIIKNSTLSIEFNSHDNWNGGIDYWDIVFQLKYKDYISVVDHKEDVEKRIFAVLEQFHYNESNVISGVIIKPQIERFIDWQAIIPETKESVIKQIEEEKKLLTAIATGRSYKEDGIEDEYRIRHDHICALAAMAGFDYPVECESLAEWWAEVRPISSYAERRAYISNVFSPVLKLLRESDNSNNAVFAQIANRSAVIKKATDDATLFLRNGEYASAVDRIHTAFHGYLRQLLTEHQVAFVRDDSISALYNKLHDYYGNCIQPPDVATKIKTIMRSGAGIIHSVNELRNNNTIAHPNGPLIQEREARLVIGLLDVIVDYIEDIEKELAV